MYGRTYMGMERSTFLIDGGATASYFYGPLRPEKA